MQSARRRPNLDIARSSLLCFVFLPPYCLVPALTRHDVNTNVLILVSEHTAAFGVYWYVSRNVLTTMY